MDRALLGATIPGQSGPGSDGNKGLLCIPLSSSITWTSPSDCLVSYPGHSFLSGGGLNSLQRSCRCIPQPRPTGQNMCVYICMHISVCVCVCVYFSMCVCVCFSVSACVYVLVYVFISVSVYLYIHVRQSVCVCVCVCVCECVMASVSMCSVSQSSIQRFLRWLWLIAIYFEKYNIKILLFFVACSIVKCQGLHLDSYSDLTNFRNHPYPDPWKLTNEQKRIKKAR